MDVLVLGPAIFVVVGLAFAGLGARTLAAGRAFERTARPAEAEVTDVRWERVGRAGDRSQLAFAVLRFVLPDGRTVETQAMYGTNLPPTTGARVPILYDPADPTRARIAGGLTGAAPALVSGCFIAFGAVFALVGAALLVLLTQVDLP